MRMWRQWSKLILTVTVGLAIQSLLPPATLQIPAQALPKDEERPFSLAVNVDLVLLNATVVDDQGTYVPGLKKEDFSVYEDDENQEISDFLPMDAPFNLVILVDNSTSTKGSLGLIKKAAFSFADELRPDDRISFFEINYFVTMFCDFTSDRKILKQHINKLSSYPYGGSKIYDGVAQGIKHLRQVGPSRKALVLLSDNMENSSALKFEDLRLLIAQNDVVLYSVTIWNQEGQKGQLEKYINNPKAEEPYVSNAKASLSVLEEVYDLQNERMRTLAEESGGRMLPVKNLADLSGEYSKVAEELRHTYSLAYYSKNHWHDGTIRKVRVEVKNPNYKVRTRTSYFVPQD